MRRMRKSNRKEDNVYLVERVFGVIRIVPGLSIYTKWHSCVVYDGLKSREAPLNVLSFSIFFNLGIKHFFVVI